VRGPGFILVADLASEIKMIRLFHYRGDGLSLPCKLHFTANVTKLSALITQLRDITKPGLTLLGSRCGIYDTRVNGCGVHDGLMQYGAIFSNLPKYFIFSIYIYLTQTSLRTQATGKANSQVKADFYR